MYDGSQSRCCCHAAAGSNRVNSSTQAHNYLVPAVPQVRDIAKRLAKVLTPRCDDEVFKWCKLVLAGS